MMILKYKRILEGAAKVCFPLAYGSALINMGLFHSVAYAGVLNTAGQTHTVLVGDTPESWRVSDGAALFVTPDADTQSITVGLGGVFDIQGGRVISAGGPAISITDAVANIAHSSIFSATDNGLQVSYSSGQPPSMITVSDSNIAGQYVGAFIAGGAHLQLDNTQIIGMGGDGGNSFDTQGVGIVNLGGSVSLNHQSAVVGQSAGLLIEAQKAVDITIDSSRIEGVHGPAILVNNVDHIAAQQAVITIINGSSLNSGNQTLLSVEDNSQAMFNISNTVLKGDVYNQLGSTTAVSMSNGAVLNGAMKNISELMIDDSSQWSVTDNSSINNLNNQGVIAFNPSGVGKVLTIDGDYHANGGTLIFNSVLKGDDSLTDKMQVTGNTSGITNVRVNSMGGSGAATINGVELINVEGDSRGEFIQQGRIVAGAYEYHLARGEGSQAGNWYLTSGLLGSGGVSTPYNSAEIGEEKVVASAQTAVIRPDAASYIANLSAANQMFVTRIQDRSGTHLYTDPVTGQQKTTSLWLRSEGGHNGFHSGSDQLTTQSNRYVMQLGGDVAQWTTGNSGVQRLGLMAGYGNSSSNTTSHVSGYTSKASVDGYSVGLYSSWYQNDTDQSGLYLDSWAQYGWFTNNVTGEDLATESYRSAGVTASLETGYTFKMTDTAQGAFFLQPQGQVMWLGVKADNHTEANGSNITGQGSDNVQTRLGLKAFMRSSAEEDKMKGRVFQPFVETNWINNKQAYGVTMDNISVKQQGAKNIAELKTGVEGQITPSLNIWGNVAQQWGSKGYSDTALMLGVQYRY